MGLPALPLAQQVEPLPEQQPAVAAALGAVGTLGTSGMHRGCRDPPTEECWGGYPPIPLRQKTLRCPLPWMGSGPPATPDLYSTQETFS